MRHLCTIVILLINICSSSFAFDRADCSFDTISENSLILSNNYNLFNIGTEGSTGWRVALQNKRNGNLTAYLGHNFTPTASKMNKLGFANYFDTEAKKTLDGYEQNGIYTTYSKRLDVSPLSYSIVAYPYYNGEQYIEEISTYQVGDNCSFMSLLRYPQNTSSDTEVQYLKTEMAGLSNIAYSYTGPVELYIDVFAPAGALGIGIGLMLPLILIVCIWFTLREIGTLGAPPLDIKRRITAVIAPLLGTAVSSAILLPSVLSNEKFIGIENAAFFALSGTVLLTYIFINFSYYLPLAVSASVGLISALYLVAGWYQAPIPYFITLGVGLIGTVSCYVTAYFAYLDYKDTKHSVGLR